MAEEQESVTRVGPLEFEPEEAGVYAEALKALQQANVPFAVGGACALQAHTGIRRSTKDLDLYLKPPSLKTALDALRQAGFRTFVEEPHWLAKGYRDPYFVDLIFGNSNGLLRVDDEWLQNGPELDVVGTQARAISVEDLVATKTYIGVRHCFDGADVAHLIRAVQGNLDWQRVLSRLQENRVLLLWQLIFFQFVYPAHSDYVPQDLMEQLLSEHIMGSTFLVESGTCQGPLLDPFSFSVDIEDWGYKDARDLAPIVDSEGNMLD